MHTIMDIIYGVPLTKEISDKICSWEENNSDKWYEDKDHRCCGFTLLYHGSSEGLVGYCGVLLGSYDETYDWLRIDNNIFNVKSHQKQFKSINIEPTQNQIDGSSRLISNLDDELKNLIPEVGIYIINGTN